MILYALKTSGVAGWPEKNLVIGPYLLNWGEQSGLGSGSGQVGNGVVFSR